MHGVGNLFAVNFFRASGGIPLPKKDSQTEKGNFSKKTFKFFLRKHVNAEINKWAPQCVTLEHVIARSAKLRFRRALASRKIRLNFEKILYISLASGSKSKETSRKFATLCNAG